MAFTDQEFWGGCGVSMPRHAAGLPQLLIRERDLREQRPNSDPTATPVTTPAGHGEALAATGRPRYPSRVRWISFDSTMALRV